MLNMFYDITLLSKLWLNSCFSKVLLVSFPAQREGAEMAWFPLFVHLLNWGGIPPQCKPLIQVCTLVTSKQILVVHTLTYVDIVCIMRDLNHALPNALQQLGTPEVIHWNSDLRLLIMHVAAYWLVWEVTMLPDASVCSESVLGKWVAFGGSFTVILQLLATHYPVKLITRYVHTGGQGSAWFKTELWQQN